MLGVLSGFLVGYSKHPLEATPWLFAVSVVPAAAAAAVVASLGRHRGRVRGGLWWVAAVSAITVVVVAGSAGAIAVQSLRFGPSRVNWLGDLQWCGIYGVALLPLTLPLAWAATRLLWRQDS